MAKRKKTKKSRIPKGVWLFSLLLLLGTVVTYFYFDSSYEVATPHTFRKQVPKGYTSVGIDVSHHQGEVDWNELFVEKGFDSIIGFVYCKATEGEDHLDTQWRRNRKTLNDMGIVNGAYHYFKPFTDPTAQAKYFLENWKTRDIDLPPALDIEEEGENDEDLIKRCKIWLSYVEKKTGMRPIIYTSLHFYETKFRNKLKGYLFWLAAYSREPEYMNEKEVIHWQFSEEGRLPGTDELIDLNVSKLPY